MITGTIFHDTKISISDGDRALEVRPANNSAPARSSFRVCIFGPHQETRYCTSTPQPEVSQQPLLPLGLRQVTPEQVLIGVAALMIIAG